MNLWSFSVVAIFITLPSTYGLLCEQSIQVWLLKLVCCHFETFVIYLAEMVCYILLKSCVICPYIYLDVVLLIC